MIFRLLDRKVDKVTAAAAYFLRKAGRRTEKTYSTAYRHWLGYISKRSKDLSVKATMLILTYCTFTVVRAAGDLYKLSPTVEAMEPYSAMVAKLDNYNETGTVAEPSAPVEFKPITFHREGAKVFREFFMQRDK